MLGTGSFARASSAAALAFALRCCSGPRLRARDAPRAARRCAIAAAAARAARSRNGPRAPLPKTTPTPPTPQRRPRCARCGACAARRSVMRRHLHAGDAASHARADGSSLRCVARSGGSLCCATPRRSHVWGMMMRRAAFLRAGSAMRALWRGACACPRSRRCPAAAHAFWRVQAACRAHQVASRPHTHQRCVALPARPPGSRLGHAAARSKQTATDADLLTEPPARPACRARRLGAHKADAGGDAFRGA